VTNTSSFSAPEYPEDQLKTAAQKLYNYLWSRHLPPSDASIQTKAVVLESKLMKKSLYMSYIV